MPKAVAKVELMIQDGTISGIGIITEQITLELPSNARDRFLDGPACRRMGVVDFDPATAAPLPPPATFTPFGAKDLSRGAYPLADASKSSPTFIATNAFGTAFETMCMFEEPGALGRQVTWAFGREQLLIVPRAGEWDNAFYERATGSLQFFWFEHNTEVIYTALSRDIVAHECGHALLDAVVPSLQDAATPESSAIHEGMADLIAVLMALRSDALRDAALKKANYSIADTRVFSSIAESFGAARTDGDGPRGALRDLLNQETMSTVDRSDFHQLSTVLSALFYEFLVSTYNELLDRATGKGNGEPGLNRPNAANRALAAAAHIFRRLLLRGIDYLPPGELTFADVGRATLAADIAAEPVPNPDRTESREAFAHRFVARGIVANAEDLTSTQPVELALRDVRQLVDIRDSDWAAYQFVEHHRSELGIPAGTPFLVLPRVDASKAIGFKVPGQNHYAIQRELIMKVSWDVVEDNNVEGVEVAHRRVRTGATLAWRWPDGAVLALVHSDVTNDDQRIARDTSLSLLVSRGLIAVRNDAEGAASEEGPVTDASGNDDPYPRLRVVEGVVRVTDTQRLLHIDVAP